MVLWLGCAVGEREIEFFFQSLTFVQMNAHLNAELFRLI